jgi:hypothetical protein
MAYTTSVAVKETPFKYALALLTITRQALLAQRGINLSRLGPVISGQKETGRISLALIFLALVLKSFSSSSPILLLNKLECFNLLLWDLDRILKITYNQIDCCIILNAKKDI